MVLAGGLTTQLLQGHHYRTIFNRKRLGGALQGAGQGFMKDPKPKTKTDNQMIVGWTTIEVINYHLGIIAHGLFKKRR